MAAIEEARTNSFKNSVYGIVKAGELLYAESVMSDEGLPRNENILDQIDFNGEQPEAGEVIVSSDGKVKAALVYGGKCFLKVDEEIEMLKEFTECVVPEEGSLGGDLPETDYIAYVNDPTNIGENATACIIEGNEFTHILDKRDNKTYKVTKIGDQCWFAENLAYTTPECLNATWTSTAPYDACRVNGGAGWDKDEVKYQWGSAMNGATTEGAQGLCPAGWTIPTDNEWKTLEMYLGMTQEQADLTDAWRGTNQGEQLKSTNPSWGGTNTVGFNAMPVGDRITMGTLNNVGSFDFWWSSSPSGSSAWIRGLNSSDATVYRITVSQAFGFSVRCILGE